MKHVNGVPNFGMLAKGICSPSHGADQTRRNTTMYCIFDLLETLNRKLQGILRQDQPTNTTIFETNPPLGAYGVRHLYNASQTDTIIVIGVQEYPPHGALAKYGQRTGGQNMHV